jgi:hypothetical protein
MAATDVWIILVDFIVIEITFSEKNAGINFVPLLVKNVRKPMTIYFQKSELLSDDREVQ